MSEQRTSTTKRIRITLTCNECGKRWKVSPDSDPQCPKCNGVDYEVSEPEPRAANGTPIDFHE